MYNWPDPIFYLSKDEKKNMKAYLVCFYFANHSFVAWKNTKAVEGLGTF